MFAAARANALGSATESTCFTDTTDSQQCCNTGMFALRLSPNPGKNSFQNVTKYLLYVYACVNGTIERTALFDSSTEDWYWSYTNDGLRLAQLRFYPGLPTTVPSGGQSC